MSENQSRRPRRVTYTQLQNLWEFLNSHREIASGYNKSTQAREHSKVMWVRAASILNSAGEGAIKSGPEWSKYWVDFKAKIKRKNRIIRDARLRTGGGPSNEQELSEIELRFLQILGEDYGSGLPGVQVQPFIRQQENEDESTHTPGISHPSYSEEGSEDPIYLEVVDSNEHENIVQQEDVRELSPYPPTTSSAQVSTTNQPSPIQILSPQQQISSVPPVPAEPHSSQARRIRADPPRRRRQRRQRILTSAEAREQLVLASQARAEAEQANSQSIAQGVHFLGEMTAIFRRMEERMSGGAPTGE